MERKRIMKPLDDEVENLWMSFPRSLTERKFGRFAQLYAFTTENIAGYFHNLDLENARVLTVCGSGDHIVNAHLRGAEQVTSFDVNILAKLFSELKIAALQKLSFDEFKDFFLLECLDNEYNNRALDIDVYRRLRGLISDEAVSFFDRAYGVFSQDGSQLRKSSLFNTRHDKNELKLMCNPYLKNSEQYETAKARIAGKEWNWINSDVVGLERELREAEFDIILLSNIADYAEKMFPERAEPLQDFRDRVVTPLSRHLRPNGRIVAAYVYDARTEPNTHNHGEIDNPTQRQNVFGRTSLGYRELHFKSVIPERKDAVILLQK